MTSTAPATVTLRRPAPLGTALAVERDGDGLVRAEIVWAALDCPSGIAAAEAAQPYQVFAWPAGRDGRKLTACSALLGPGGEVLATARALWLTVPWPPAGGPS
jgi:hypothetical protein